MNNPKTTNNVHVICWVFSDFSKMHILLKLNVLSENKIMPSSINFHPMLRLIISLSQHGSCCPLGAFLFVPWHRRGLAVHSSIQKNLDERQRWKQTREFFHPIIRDSRVDSLVSRQLELQISSPCWTTGPERSLQHPLWDHVG